MREIEKILEEDEIVIQAFTWKQLRYEAGLNISGRNL